MEYSFTEKQKNLLFMLKDDSFERLNILYGSVRSGKTYITLIIFALWVATMPKGNYCLMSAKTLKTLEHNCLKPLRDMFGDEIFTYSMSKKQAVLFGRDIILEGANDDKAEDKIRGVTLQGAYIDEITLINYNFFKMMLSRLSLPKAKFFGTTNPDSPNHWLKTEFLDRQNELSLFVDKFILDDNTFLSSEYIENLKKEYTGIYYDRFILGNFVRAEGLVFPKFANNVKDYIFNIDDITKRYDGKERKQSLDIRYRINIGVDFGGNKSKTCFVATAISRTFKNLYVLDEHIVTPKECFNSEIIKDDIEKNIISYDIDADRICEELFKFYKKIKNQYGEVSHITCDGASPTMIASVKSYFKRNGERYNNISAVKKTPVSDRPKTIDMLLNTGRLKFLNKCKNLIHALSDLVWDEKKENIPEDKNENNINDIYDAFCYSWINFTPRIDFILRD